MNFEVTREIVFGRLIRMVQIRIWSRDKKSSSYSPILLAALPLPYEDPPPPLFHPSPYFSFLPVVRVPVCPEGIFTFCDTNLTRPAYSLILETLSQGTIFQIRYSCHHLLPFLNTSPRHDHDISPNSQFVFVSMYYTIQTREILFCLLLQET